MLNYVLSGGVVTLPGFFPADKYWDIKKDLDNLQWRETHQPFKGPYGNRLQAFPLKYITQRTLEIQNYYNWNRSCRSLCSCNAC